MRLDVEVARSDPEVQAVQVQPAVLVEEAVQVQQVQQEEQEEQEDLEELLVHWEVQEAEEDPVQQELLVEQEVLVEAAEDLHLLVEPEEC